MKPIIAVAPMMDCTDRHDRYFLRLISKKINLYTEMLTSQSLIHGNRKKLLAFNPEEKYVGLQLGGSDPKELALCAKFGEQAGFDEINLNVGCPSARVKSGNFGACLMLKPALVANCVSEMVQAVNIPITVKCRIGVDQQDSYEALHQFASFIFASGAKMLIIHARKAWLHGLSPRENREIPPLQYDYVYRLKKDFKSQKIIINGGILDAHAVKAHLNAGVDGVMIGREAYSNPWILAEIERDMLDDCKDLKHYKTRHEVLLQFIPYLENQLKNGIKLSSITRHILGLYKSQPGAAAFRRYLSENAHKGGIEVIYEALKLVGNN